MSIFSAISHFISSIFGGNSPKINIPAPEVPAAPAPTNPFDTGATIAVGADKTKNDRVSSTTRKKKGTTSVDILGGLGLGNVGISI